MILKEATIEELAEYLKEKKWLQPDETLRSTSIPGSGNMNYVTRVHTDKRTFILKQSMPYVQKYPVVPAPQERIAIEYKFYNTISCYPTLQRFMPKAIGFDPANFVLVMEDANNLIDGSIIYHNNNQLTTQHIFQLMAYLNELHRFTKNSLDTNNDLRNAKMKALNALHIFDFPFQQNNGYDLDNIQPGLQAIALPYKTDDLLKIKMVHLKSIYLSNGNYLLHGDYYPGSWLMNDTEIKVIDPEFCFYGPVEFDLGVFIAHLKLAGCPDSLKDVILENYQEPIDKVLLNAFTGTEILRRLIGLAQLPLTLSIDEKKSLLAEAASLLQTCQ